MTRSGASILSLVLILIASNAWWAYRMFDAGVSYTYLGVSLKENEAAVTQLIALVPVIARGATRDEVLAAARQPGDSEPFEKQGFVWVGQVGLQFDPEGRLQKVSRAWSYE